MSRRCCEIERSRERVVVVGRGQSAQIDGAPPAFRAEPARPTHSECPALSGLDPGVVPVRAWPLRKWYYADPLWYYHVPAREHRLSTDPHFYELVDPPLRRLCRIVHAAGLLTTPSCSGHFYVQERFARIWVNLRRDADAIRAAGQQQWDSESGQCCMFRDANYTLPWPDFASFFAQLDALQPHGYIGIAFPPANDPADARRSATILDRLRGDAFAASAIRVEFDAGLTQTLGQPIVGVRVEPRSVAQRETAWATVTRYFARVLAEAARAEM